MILTQSTLKERIFYNPATGEFARINCAYAPASGRWVGKPVGWLTHNGYLRISVANKEYPAHHLAWLYMTGALPEVEIDHRNGVRSDNKWTNIRSATKSINMQNQRRARINSTTGLLGVNVAGNRYAARLQVEKRKHYLGMFDTPQEAHQAYLTAKRKLHPGNTL